MPSLELKQFVYMSTWLPCLHWNPTGLFPVDGISMLHSNPNTFLFHIDDVHAVIKTQTVLLFLLAGFPCLAWKPNSYCSCWQDLHALIETQTFMLPVDKFSMPWLKPKQYLFPGDKIFMPSLELKHAFLHNNFTYLRAFGSVIAPKYTIFMSLNNIWTICALGRSPDFSRRAVTNRSLPKQCRPQALARRRESDYWMFTGPAILHDH